MSLQDQIRIIVVCVTALARPLIGLSESLDMQISASAPAETANKINWRAIGAGGGGALFHPTLSPHDPEFALVACDMTGTYATHDGGQSWRMINLQQIARQFVFDPIDPKLVYARAGGLYKSADRGVSWTLIYPSPSEVQGFASIGDHADLSIVTVDRTKRRVTAFAVDPQYPAKLYATVQIEGEFLLLTSSDSGDHWRTSRVIGQPVLNLFVDPASPAEDRTLYVTHELGVSIRKANSWRVFPPPSGVEKITSYSAGYDATSKTFVVYAISGKSYFNTNGAASGIFITKNGGITWTNVQGGLIANQPAGTALPEWRNIATSLYAPSTVYVSYSGLIGADGKESFGVAQSEDFGRTWNLRWRDFPQSAHPVPGTQTMDGWLDERFGPGWSENPFSIGVAPHNPQIAYATDFGRAVKTEDGGRTWHQVYTKRKQDHGWITRGLDVTNVNSIVFDPFDPSRVYLTATDIGLMQSDDSGESWSSATNSAGIPERWRSNTYWLTPDPMVKGRMWASMSGVHDLPREKMWRTRRPSSFNGGILRTDDSGRTWSVCSLDIGEAAVTHLLVDTNSPVDNRTLYACAFGHGVLKSSDGGRHWSLKNSGIGGQEPLAWRIYQRSKDRALFLVVSRRRDDSTSEPQNDGAIYRSDDGAETWKPLSLPSGANGPTSLCVDSETEGMLLLSTWGHKSPAPLTSDIGGGIYLSVDDGVSWTGKLVSDPHIYEITYDSRNRTHYACGFNAAAYVSPNNGSDWERIPGYDFKWGKRIDPDPRDPAMIYISTYGGGVWHGPAHADLASDATVSRPPPGR